MRMSQTYLEQHSERELVLESGRGETGSYADLELSMDWSTDPGGGLGIAIEAPDDGERDGRASEPHAAGCCENGRKDQMEQPRECRDALDAAQPARDSRKGARNKALGKQGEEAAARYLRHLGYDIVERNWECTFGEADIVARDGDTLVFVEVKTRKSIKKGFPAEAVGKKKQARYERIAACFLQDYDVFDIPVRFDVVALLVVGDDRALIKHYVNAFGWDR